MRSRCAALISLLALLPAAPVSARCGAAELDAFRRSAPSAIRCIARRLGATPEEVSCRPTPPPCARSALAATRALVFGAHHDPPARVDRRLGRQLRCQKAIARASAAFLRQRVRERLDAVRGQRQSRRRFRPLSRRCAVSVVDAGAARLPDVGSPCATTIGRPGEAVVPERVGLCLRAGLERIVDDVSAARLRPNVILVVTDDQRWDTLPHMPAVTAKLVERGVTFTNAFVPTPLCAPSRASFYSGRYAHNTGVGTNAPPGGGAPRFDATSTLATWLHGGGYITGLFGKYMNGYAQLSPAVPPGWDAWHVFVDDAAPLFYDYTLNENGRLVRYGRAPADYSTDVLRRRAVTFIDDHAASPFFLVLAPYAPHVPATPAPRHAGRLAGVAPWRPPGWREPDVTDKPPWLQWLASVAADAEATDAFRIAQLESLLAVDEAVEALLAAVEHRGLTDHTVVIFTSDNGHLWGEHWLSGNRVVYEESIRVPLVVSYPLRVAAPTGDDRLVLNIDVAPTLAELAGVPVPIAVDGQSFVPMLVGAPTPWRVDFLLEQFTSFLVPPYVGVRTTQRKYVLTGAAEELYDLVDDPHEMDNLLMSEPVDPGDAAVAGRLRARVGELQTE